MERIVCLKLAVQHISDWLQMKAINHNSNQEEKISHHHATTTMLHCAQWKWVS